MLKVEEEGFQIQSKVKGYDLLLEAVDILSQQIDIEQIYQVSIELYKQLLDIDICYLFTRTSPVSLKIFKTSLYNHIGKEFTHVQITENLKEYALLNAGIISSPHKFVELFDRAIIHELKPLMIVPFIIKNKIEGLMFLPSKKMDMGYSEEEISSIFALMKLLNSSLEHYDNVIKIKETDRSLEDNSFKLKALNYSSKVLLKELILDDLYEIAVDTFLEISRGSQSALFVYDEASEEYRMKTCKLSDKTFSNQSNYALRLNKNTKIKNNKIILDILEEEDQKYFYSIFPSFWEVLAHFSTRYIVLLERGTDICGFVTLSNKKNGGEYNKGLMEVLETLASNTYFAIKNANYDGKESLLYKNLEKRYGRQIELNQLMKSINAADSIEKIIERVAQTILLSYKVKKYILAIYDKGENKFRIQRTSISNLNNKKIEVDKNWDLVFTGEKVVKHSKNEIRNYLPSLEDFIGVDVSGMAIIPISTNKSKENFLGAIIVFEQSNFRFINNEILLYIESIATHMAPMIQSINIEECAEVILNDDIHELVHNLSHEITWPENKEKNLYIVDFKILDKTYIFEENPYICKLKTQFKRVYRISRNRTLIVTNSKEKCKVFDEYKGIAYMKVKIHKMGENFKTLSDLDKLLLIE